MKFVSWLIGLSLAANLALAGWWFSKRSAEPADPVRRVSDAKQSGSARRGGSTDTAEDASAPAVGASGKATWAQVQSSDLKEFIQRLRAIGCPEETIQDIIVAEVNRIYAAKFRHLWPESMTVELFWKTQTRDPARMRQDRERYRQRRELEKEKSALLVELLGIDPEKERNKADGIEDWTYWRMARLDFIPESKREAVGRFLEDFDEKMQDFYAGSRGLWDAETRAEQRRLEAERLQGLAQFLTPQELREFELRDSQTANQLENDLRYVSVSREEYEAIFDIRKKYGESIYNYGDLGEEGRKQAEATRKAMEAEIAAALGGGKAKEVQRSQDSSYQQLARLAKRNNLPADTAGLIYDYKDGAEEGAKQIRENTSLNPDERTTALQQLRADTEKAIKTALGEEIFNRYRENGGWWMNNIAPGSGSPRRAR